MSRYFFVPSTQYFSSVSYRFMTIINTYGATIIARNFFKPFVSMSSLNMYNLYVV